MKRILLILLLLSSNTLIQVYAQGINNSPSLKKAFENKFYIGAALNVGQLWDRDQASSQVIKHHFNSIVAENAMKSMHLQPTEGKFNFKDADQFVEFGEKNNMFIIGHTLIWHSQAPSWFFKDENGNDVSKEVLTQRMKTHITTVVSRYKGRIHGWDVVNEAIMDDGSYRKSKFYQIMGEDFIRLAFQFAHEADPNVELYYNDYSMAQPGKRQGVVNMVEKLKSSGVKVSGIGMQGHLHLDHPKIEEFEKSIQAYAALGVKVMITELDITVLKSPDRRVGAEVSANFQYQNEMNPYKDGLPEDKANQLYNRYSDFFSLFLKYQDKISRVTLWGVSDGDSWLNNWPMRGRTDYPLLFDRQLKPKPVVQQIIELAKKDKK